MILADELEIASAARAYEDVAAGGVAELFAPELAEGEKIPDLPLLQRLPQRTAEPHAPHRMPTPS